MVRAAGMESLEQRFLLALAASDSPEVDYVPMQWQGQEVHVHPGRWIITFADSTAGQAQRRLRNAGIHARIQSPLGAPGVFSVAISPRKTFRWIELKLHNVRGYRAIEPDFAVSLLATTPNDPQYAQQWSLNNTGQTGGTPDADIDAPEAWDIATGDATLVVAVIDTGVDYTHQDLAPNIWVNDLEIPDDGLDNDGNGYIDDVRGWDFANNDNDPMDDYGHGTHVAGVLAAATHNAIGIAGAAWNVRIMPLKFMSASGTGEVSDAIAAVNYVTAMRQRGVNVRINNNSWGDTSYSDALRSAIQAQANAGILFVAAAGNTTTNIDSSPFFPAAYNLDNIISVAATTHTDARASFSNYGKTSVDLGAPGDTIRGTAMGGGYRVGSGTSYATPLVSAVAALAYGISPPGTTYATIRNAILNGGDAVSSLSGSTVTGRRLNAYGALMQLPMSALVSTPAHGAVLTTAPVDFDVRYSHPIDPASIAGGDLAVNGIPATSASLVKPNTVRFHFDATPVSAEGSQSMAIGAGAILRAGDGAAAGAYSASFRYDSAPLVVEATVPADGTSVAPPLTGIDVVLSEPIDPATVSASDLVLSSGVATSATLIDGRIVRFELSGLSAEANVAVSLAAGAFLDLHGNPSGAYAGSLRLDIGSIDWPAAIVPAGEPVMLAWRSEYAGLINSSDDVDELRITLEAGATVSLVARPDGSLVPRLALIGPGGEPVASSTLIGVSASLAHTAATAGEYRIAVSAQAGAPGSYALTLLLGASPEQEAMGGSGNDLPGLAQPIDFSPLPGGGWRGVVVGQTDVPADALSSETEPNNARDEANSAALNFTAAPAGLYQLSIEGSVLVADKDCYNLGTLDAGDILTVSLSGKDGARGILSDPYLELYREENGQFIHLLSNDDGGAGADALIHRLTINTTGRYLLLVRAAGTQVGAYDVGAVLENTGAAPNTGGAFKQESGYNDTLPNANDASASWREIRYESITAGTITAADMDFFAFPLKAEDRVTFIVESDGPLDAKLTLRSPNGTMIGKEDGSSVGLGSGSAIYALRVPLNGTYTVEVGAAAGEGGYRIRGWLSTATGPAVPPVTSDWYSVELSAGEALSAWATGSAAMGLQIADASEVVLAESAEGRIDSFAASAAGLYRVRVSGPRGTDYTLMALRSAQVDADNNDTFADAQAMTGPVIGEADGEDWYRFPVAAGQVFQVRLHALASAEGLPHNVLAAMMELYDPSGALVGTGSALGSGAVVTHAASADGEYRVRIAGSPGGGVYVLSSAAPAALVSGTEADDVLLLRLDPTGAYRLVYDNASATGEAKWAIPAGLFSSLRIEGHGGDDRLIVDYANGNPMPPDGLAFDGGAGDDRMDIGPAGVSPAEDAGPLVIDDLSGTTELTVDSNRLRLASIPENLALSLRGSAVMDLPVGGALASLSLVDQARLTLSGGTLVVGTSWQTAPALQIAPGARLDLGEQILILRSTFDQRQQDLEAMFGWIAAGRAGGTWLGDGIASHAASTDPRLTLGLIANTREDGSALHWSYGGTWVDANSIFVRLTRLGDLDLDGAVGPTDYFQIDAGFLRGQQGYSAGDTDYSGAIDADDFYAIDQGFLAAEPPLFAA